MASYSIHSKDSWKVTDDIQLHRPTKFVARRLVWIDLVGGKNLNQTQLENDVGKLNELVNELLSHSEGEFLGIDGDALVCSFKFSSPESAVLLAIEIQERMDSNSRFKNISASIGIASGEVLDEWRPGDLGPVTVMAHSLAVAGSPKSILVDSHIATWMQAKLHADDSDEYQPNVRGLVEMLSPPQESVFRDFDGGPRRFHEVVWSSEPLGLI